MKYLDVSEAQARSLIKLSVTLAREAREEYMKENPGSAVPLIAGSVGPYGSQFYDEIYTYSGACVDKATQQVLTCAAHHLIHFTGVLVHMTLSVAVATTKWPSILPIAIHIPVCVMVCLLQCMS